MAHLAWQLDVWGLGFSQLNVSKSAGFLVQAQPLASATVAALPGINFITGQQTVKHLEKCA